MNAGGLCSRPARVSICNSVRAGRTWWSALQGEDPKSKFTYLFLLMHTDVIYVSINNI